MSSREAATRYQEIVRGLLAQPQAHSTRTVKLEPSEQPNATFAARHRSAKGASLPDENRVLDAGSITLDTPAYHTPRAFSPAAATVAEAGEPDRGVFRPARGIVFAVLLGVALWALVITGILVEVIR